LVVGVEDSGDGRGGDVATLGGDHFIVDLDEERADEVNCPGFCRGSVG
jgi:hypothetical protein